MSSPRVFNLGSLNVDLVYRVPAFARPGETLSTTAHSRHAGGKGLNQSLALSRSGARVHHIGCIGGDGHWLRELLERADVNVEAVTTRDMETGHAVITVSAAGENSILLCPGANHAVELEQIIDALAAARPGDWWLCQNETNAIAPALELAKSRGLSVALNPSPVSEAVKDWPLDLVDLLVVNETEAAALSGEPEPDRALEVLARRLPTTTVFITCGARGVIHRGPRGGGYHPARKVRTVDTTGAGDTFLGFLLGRISVGDELSAALATATTAAALAVMRPGAAASIPTLAEVRTFAP